MPKLKGQLKKVDNPDPLLSVEVFGRQGLTTSVHFRESDEITTRAATIGRKLQLNDSVQRLVYRAGVCCLESLIDAGIIRCKP